MKDEGGGTPATSRLLQKHCYHSNISGIELKGVADWLQGSLGDWANTTVPAEYGVEGIPAIFLIDPEGKIIATDLRGDHIKAAAERALAKTAAGKTD